MYGQKLNEKQIMNVPKPYELAMKYTYGDGVPVGRFYNRDMCTVKTEAFSAMRLPLSELWMAKLHPPANTGEMMTKRQNGGRICTSEQKSSEVQHMTFMTTQRLILRNVTAKDVDIMYDYRNNEICGRYQRGQTKDHEGLAALVERRKDDRISVDAPFMVAVALKDTDEMVGEIVVMPEDDTISLGYTFSYKHHRKGYAFEALTALINMLHASYPKWDFISFTEPENKPSMALLKKLGYKDMGYIPSMDSQVFGKWTTPETEAEIAQAAIRE